ncbi:MAG: mannosyltransferase family protein [Thermoleophilia bacterium]
MATPEADSELARSDRRSAWQAATAAVASRLLAAFAAFAATYWLASRLGPALRPGHRRLTFAAEPLNFILGAWKHWDGDWFILIAQYGYDPIRAAFFPLYPDLMHVLAVPIGNYPLAGILISLVCYGAAMVVLYRLVKADLGSRVALWSVLLLSFAPTAFYFQAVYSESLFLLLTVLSFAAGRQGRWLLAGLAGLLAALTRSAGLLLALPLAWMWLEQRRGRPIVLPGSTASAAVPSAKPSHVLSLGWLLLVPAGLLIYMAYTWYRFHNALLFMSAEKHWHRRLALPTTTVINGTHTVIQSLRTIAAHPATFFTLTRLPFRDQWITVSNLTAFIALLIGLALLALCWRKLPSVYTLFAAVSLGLPLCYPTPGTPLLSLPRFVLVDFPLFIALAAVVAEHRKTRWLLLVLMTAAMLLFTAWFANDMWVA